MTLSAQTASVPRPTPPILVGREREERLLRHYLTTFLTGQGRLVLLRGEAGIGKTSLVASLELAATAAGALVLRGGCYDLSATPPYGPWREIAADLREIGGLTSLSDTLPVNDEIAVVGGQGMLFEQVREALAAVVANRPLMVVLEDLHWADPASLDLLRFIARQLASAPLLLVATYRAEELSRHHPLYQLLPNLVREVSAERLTLRPLNETAVRELVIANYPMPEPAATRLTDYLQAHSEGNPFYVHELLRSLQADDTLRTDRDSWELGDLTKQRVPDLLRQIVDGRVAQLGEEVRDLLALAAVIGQEVPLAVWKAVAGWEEEPLLEVIDRAVEAHLLQAVDDGASVRFDHALTREALYESVAPPRRRIWHRQVAELLSELAAADPDAVAHHFTQAGDARSAEWLVRAGERALRAFAWRTATDRFKAVALMLESDPVRSGERGWLLYRISRLLRFVNAATARSYIEEAERIAAEVGDATLAAYAMVDGGMLRCFQGDLRGGLDEMEAGVAVLDALPVEGSAAARGMTAWVADSPSAASRKITGASQSGVNPRRGALILWLLNVGRVAETQAMAETYLDQVALFTQFDDLELGSIADAHFGMAWVSALLGKPDVAREHFERSHSLQRETGHYGMLVAETAMELELVVLPYLTTNLAERRRLKTEFEVNWNLIGGAYLEMTGDTTAVDRLPQVLHLMEILLLEGDWVDERERDRLACLDKIWRSGHLAGLSAMARYQGLADLASELVREGLPAGPDTEPGGVFFRSALGLQRVAAELAIDGGDSDLARVWIEAHDHWLAWSGSVLGRSEAQLLWARYYRLTGDVSSSWAHALAALEHANNPQQPLAQLVAHRFLGELATEAGRFAEAGEHLGKSLALADACAAPFERALILLALADLRIAGGDASEARILLEEVRAICTPLSAAPALERVAALETTLNSAPAPVANQRGGLSAREIEVLRLVADGLTDAEVASHLWISPRTVGQHLRSIYNKLGVSSRTAATRIAVERQLL